jgi:hypothetical protein
LCKAKMSKCLRARVASRMSRYTPGPTPSPTVHVPVTQAKPVKSKETAPIDPEVLELSKEAAEAAKLTGDKLMNS